MVFVIKWLWPWFAKFNLHFVANGKTRYEVRLDSGSLVTLVCHPRCFHFCFVMFTGVSERLLSSNWGHGLLLIFWMILLWALIESWLVCFGFSHGDKFANGWAAWMECLREPEKVFQSSMKLQKWNQLWNETRNGVLVRIMTLGC